MGGNGNRSSMGVAQQQQAPIRQSPRKPSQPSQMSSNISPQPSSSYALLPNGADPLPAPIPYLLPTPLSNSPSTTSSHPNAISRYPPQFDHSHPNNNSAPASVAIHAAPSLSHSVSVSARASTALYTPRSPYRPGEYGRRAETASERTKIERRLFGDDQGVSQDALERIRREEEEQEEEEEGWKRNRGSSPLQPAFEARLILRKGAPVDLISWLRRNFHHIPSPSHPSLTSSTSLLAIRALLAERFPRLPESEELVKAVTAAFPRVHMDYGQPGSGEPPMIRGLVWNGKETVYEDGAKSRVVSGSATDNGAGRRNVIGALTPDKRSKGKAAAGSSNAVGEEVGNGVATSSKNAKWNIETLPQRSGERSTSSSFPTLNGTSTSIANFHSHNPQPSLDPSRTRSPTQSTLVSPTTSSSRRVLPNTPARSVLEEFAVLATLAEKTPVTRTQSLPGDRVVTDAANELARVCDSFGGPGASNGSGLASGFSGNGHGEGSGYGGEESSGRLVSRKRGSVGGSGFNGNGKRRASASTPPPFAGGSTTPDKLEGLLAAAETIEGSPMASFLDTGAGDDSASRANAHKRRRTIGGMGSMRELIDGGRGGSPGRGRGGIKGRLMGSAGWRAPGMGLEHVPENHTAEMGSASDADDQLSSSARMSLLPPPPPGPVDAGGKAKKARAAPGTSARGRGRGKGSVKAGTGKGRAHADSNASQMSLSAVSTIMSGSNGDGMDIDMPSGSGSSMGLGLGMASTYPNTPNSTTPIGGDLSTRLPPAYTSHHPTTPSHYNTQLPHTPGSVVSNTPHPNYPRPRKSNELATEGLFPGIDCKPPHPYHEMIRHAIEHAPEGRLQLSQIYASIAERFPFFGGLDERKTAGWQNSIRHNLSLKKMFVRVNKVDGIPDEGGKGGWWTVEPGIPDEGRPGRKSKSSTANSANTVDPLAGPGPAWKGAALAQVQAQTQSQAQVQASGQGGVMGGSQIVGGRKSEGSCSDVSGVVGAVGAGGSEVKVEENIIRGNVGEKAGSGMQMGTGEMGEVGRIVEKQAGGA